MAELIECLISLESNPTGYIWNDRSALLLTGSEVRKSESAVTAVSSVASA